MFVSATQKRSSSNLSLAVRLVALLLVLACLLFLPAGRLDWLQGWLFVLAYGAFLLVYSTWTVRNDPGQMAERSQAGPNVKRWDRVLLAIYSGLLVGMLVLAGLDAGRFSWAPASLALQILGWLASVCAASLIWWTASVNTFLARYVRIQEERGQQVVTSGPYRFVRHPMYAGIIVLMLGIPLVLASLWALAPAALICIIFVIRTVLEDRTLQAELPGYAGYAQRTRYRLLPGIW